MKKMYCDICGREIVELPSCDGILSWKKMVITDVHSSVLEDKRDLCSVCATNLKLSMDFNRTNLHHLLLSSPVPQEK